MNYLDPSEYERYGIECTTAAAWVTAASALVDAYCRRATLAVAQYQERLRVVADRNVVRVTYLPLAVVDTAVSAIVSARGRYAAPRRGEWLVDPIQADVVETFGLPGIWADVDVASIDCDCNTGELSLPVNALGLGFNELEVTYTAGLATLPDKVKVACAQIVRNAQATPALNVRAETLDRMHFEYFSDSLVDQNVRAMLAPYVAQRVG